MKKDKVKNKKEAKVKKEEILGKILEKKVEEKKEEISKDILSDWKKILIEGFSLDSFQKDPKKESFSLESDLEKSSKESSSREQAYLFDRKYSQRGEYEEREKGQSEGYSPRRRAAFIPQIRSDFSSFGKIARSFEEFRQPFNTPPENFSDSNDEPDYSPIRAKKFSRETKSFSQIERENFEGIRRNRGYKEVRL